MSKYLRHFLIQMESRLEEQLFYNPQGNDPNAKDEISTEEHEGLCYEIVRNQDEKPLTLEEARRLVEQNYFLNKKELTEKLDVIFGPDSDPLLSQYLNNNAGDGEDFIVHDPSECEPSTEDETKYVGRGYGLLGYDTGVVEDIDEDLELDDSEEISSTISFNRKAVGDQPLPIANYGKGPPPTWSNVFADSSSDEN